MRQNHAKPKRAQVPHARSRPGKPLPPTASDPRKVWSGRLAWTAAIVFLALLAGSTAWLWRAGKRSSYVPSLPVTSAGASTASNTNASARPAKPPGGEHAAALIAQGNQLLSQGKDTEALALYRQAEQLMPQDEDVHYNLGIARARLGQTNEAVAEYETALRIFPDYVEVHNNLGNLLLRSGKVDEALKHFRAAIKALPDYAPGHNNLGNALRKAGKSQEAVIEFVKASELDTNYWEAHFNLADAYRSQNRLPEAAAEYREVLRLKAGFEPAQQGLVRVERLLASPVP